MNTIRGDSIEVMHPLFQTGEDGSTPISPLQLEVGRIDIARALLMNARWHSRLPNLTNWQACIAYGAAFDNQFYAVVIFGAPVARAFNGRNYLELRRMAINARAPKNTGSRLLRVTKMLVKREFPAIVKLVSYQDTAAHAGTIYKAAGWYVGGMKKNIGTGWGTRNRPAMQTDADKVRWECDL